jgi:P4 family phage/plasmid primase-like protien
MTNISTARRAVKLSACSDPAIAEHMLAGELRGLIHCEGWFWRYDGVCWQPISSAAIQQTAMSYDQRKVGGRTITLGSARLASIEHCLRLKVAKPGFFDEQPRGINCANGFIKFEPGAPPVSVPHDPEHRRRHVLPGAWQPGRLAALPANSLLGKLLGGCFKDDPDAAGKIALLAGLAGAVALGCGTMFKKAVVLLGPTAQNGKSQILELLRGLLPISAISTIPPGKFGDEHHLVGLVGKLLNASDELGTAQAITSDAFKAVVTGEPIRGADKYKPAVDFRPKAQHVFACNRLPNFQSGMDRGVMRRLVLIPFNRTIPEEERIADIGQRIAREEADLLLAWAVEGATRLLERGRFEEPASSRETLAEWAYGSDPVQAFIADCVRPALTAIGEKPPRLSSKTLFTAFEGWCARERRDSGRFAIGINSFVQRVYENLPPGARYRKSNRFRGFEGLRLVNEGGKPSSSSTADPQEEDDRAYMGRTSRVVRPA